MSMAGNSFPKWVKCKKITVQESDINTLDVEVEGKPLSVLILADDIATPPSANSLIRYDILFSPGADGYRCGGNVLLKANGTYDHYNITTSNNFPSYDETTNKFTIKLSSCSFATDRNYYFIYETARD